MILPNRPQGFSSYNKNKLKKGKNIIAIVLIIALIVAAVFLIIRFGSKGAEAPELELLYQNIEFKKLNEEAEKILIENPLDYETLVLNGLGYFYRGVEIFSEESRIPFFELAVQNLRKAELVGSGHKAKIEYMVGRAYYLMGRQYHDLALKYLLESLNHNFQGEEVYITLGMTYKSLGFYKNALEYFYQALDADKSEVLYNSIAYTHYLAGEFNKAEEVYAFIIDKFNNNEFTNNEFKVSVTFQLGLIYLDRDELEKAQQQFEAVIAENNKHVDAYYFLGNVYEKQAENNPQLRNKYLIKARSEWRNAYKIDHIHSGVLEKLFEN